PHAVRRASAGVGTTVYTHSGTDTTQSSNVIQKARSYNDLVAAIQKLLPKLRSRSQSSSDDNTLTPDINSNNPRKSSRRMSKTFRRMPEIIVHPPEENITSSLPDLNTIFSTQKRDSVVNFVSDLNYSCPDLNFYSGYKNLHAMACSSTESFESCENQFKRPVFQRQSSWPDYNEPEEFAPISKNPCRTYMNELKYLQNSLSEIEICVYCQKLIEKCNCKPIKFKAPKWSGLSKSRKGRRRELQRKESSKHISSQKVETQTSNVNVNQPKLRRKKTDITPTDILKHKLKQSLSMHNLYASPSGHDYNHHHTIHTSTDIPQNITEFKFYNYKNEKRSNSFETITENVTFGSIDPRRTSQLSEHARFSNSLENVYSKYKSQSHPQQSNTISILKCCCGNAHCGSVVPINIYLETYYTKT
ncbi:hypothetical protein ILUMI_09620, partial [Ignelater luminosus]